MCVPEVSLLPPSSNPVSLLSPCLHPSHTRSVNTHLSVINLLLWLPVPVTVRTVIPALSVRNLCLKLYQSWSHTAMDSIDLSKLRVSVLWKKRRNLGVVGWPDFVLLNLCNTSSRCVCVWLCDCVRMMSLCVCVRARVCVDVCVWQRDPLGVGVV